MNASKRDARPVVLVVDDRQNMLRLITKVLRREATVLTADGGARAIETLERQPVDVVLSDLKMPDVDGMEVLKACRKLQPNAEFILMTAHASVPTAVEALRLGAYDYVTKPFEPDTLRALVLRALGRAAASSEGTSPAGHVREVLPGLIARSAAMIEMAELVKKVAASHSTALLLGETGTGKERIARAIHHLSPRASRRLVAVNCAAIPADLLESELFGYTKGSFTGAARDRAGLFEEANKGTLFLDEIGELRLSLQAKLTRATEARAIRRLGAFEERDVDVRLIAATHRDIEAMVEDGSFREDLWYRLNVAVIRIPPLRERREDISLLAAHFLKENAPARGLPVVGFTPAATEAMERYAWRGNVRQLRAAIERACLVASSERIDVGDLPPELSGTPRPGRQVDLSELSWQEALEAGRLNVGRHYLEDVLKRHGGQVSQAAAHAGVERESFYRLMRRYGVSK